MSKLNTELYNKNVRRNDKYKAVVDLLVYGSLDGKRNPGGKIFDNIKDLIVFAAMVGKKFEKIECVDNKNNTSIALGTFSGSGSSKNSRVDQHNIIFMFGLLIKTDMAYLRDEKVGDSISLFEQYSNGGLSLIYDWLVEGSWEADILIDKMADALVIENEGVIVNENPF